MVDTAKERHDIFQQHSNRWTYIPHYLKHPTFDKMSSVPFSNKICALSRLSWIKSFAYLDSDWEKLSLRGHVKDIAPFIQ